jgi:hypothetical protein
VRFIACSDNKLRSVCTKAILTMDGDAVADGHGGISGCWNVLVLLVDMSLRKHPVYQLLCVCHAHTVGFNAVNYGQSPPRPDIADCVDTDRRMSMFDC